jgi:hypothetical protein
MTISGILLLLNVGILWWLFLSAGNLGLKIIMLVLAVLNSWSALERFHVLPTHLGSRAIILTSTGVRGYLPRQLQARD